MRLAALSLCAFISTTCAAESDWRTSWDGTLYGYATTQALRADSVLNPGNHVARLTQQAATLDGRFYFKAENDSLRLTLRPIVLMQNDTFNSQRESYLSQWQVRLRASDAWSIAAGREVLNWGPAQFRSPSSPFYFANGRSNPLRELSGVDALKLSWTPDMQNTLTLAHVTGTGHVAQDVWRNSWLVKVDRRENDWAVGLMLAQTSGQSDFIGAHGQVTASDALLLYGEAANASRHNALQSPADPALPFSLAPRSARQTTWLAGAAYTLNNGQSLNAEYLHDDHGYRANQQAAYFARSATSPLLAGQALSYAPPLLGRDYLHLVWQSNLMASDGYWRVMATHSFTDGGKELAGYGEISLTDHVSAYGLAVLPFGNTRQEFSSLFTHSLTAGLKIALP